MDPKRHEGQSEPRGFRCPWCGAQTRQHWFPFVVGYEHRGKSGEGALWGVGREAGDLSLSFCEECRRPVMWHDQGPIWPTQTSAPPAVKGMPEEVRTDFEEARLVLEHSPRSAAALLRLSLRKLFERVSRQVEAQGDAIRLPVEHILPPTVVQALRDLRVVGDNAVPAGELAPGDDREAALALFDLVNNVVDRLITEPSAWRTS